MGLSRADSAQPHRRIETSLKASPELSNDLAHPLKRASSPDAGVHLANAKRAGIDAKHEETGPRFAIGKHVGRANRPAFGMSAKRGVDRESFSKGGFGLIPVPVLAEVQDDAAADPVPGPVQPYNHPDDSLILVLGHQQHRDDSPTIVDTNEK